MAATAILIADDHRIMRQGIRALLQNDERFDVVGEAEDWLAAVRLSEELSPDVVVMDLRMPGMNGIEATRRITAARPETRTIGLSGHLDSSLAADLMRAGVSGCVLKDAAVEELIVAIKTSLQKKFYVSPFLMNVVMSDYLGRGVAAGAGGASTRRRRPFHQAGGPGFKS